MPTPVRLAALTLFAALFTAWLLVSLSKGPRSSERWVYSRMEGGTWYDIASLNNLVFILIAKDAAETPPRRHSGGGTQAELVAPIDFAPANGDIDRNVRPMVGTYGALQWQIWLTKQGGALFVADRQTFVVGRPNQPVAAILQISPEVRPLNREEIDVAVVDKLLDEAKAEFEIGIDEKANQ